MYDLSLPSLFFSFFFFTPLFFSFLFFSLCPSLLAREFGISELIQKHTFTLSHFRTHTHTHTHTCTHAQNAHTLLIRARTHSHCDDDRHARQTLQVTFVLPRAWTCCWNPQLRGGHQRPTHPKTRVVSSLRGKVSSKGMQDDNQRWGQEGLNSRRALVMAHGTIVEVMTSTTATVWFVW